MQLNPAVGFLLELFLFAAFNLWLSGNISATQIQCPKRTLGDSRCTMVEQFSNSKTVKPSFLVRYRKMHLFLKRCRASQARKEFVAAAHLEHEFQPLSTYSGTTYLLNVFEFMSGMPSLPGCEDEDSALGASGGAGATTGATSGTLSSVGQVLIAGLPPKTHISSYVPPKTYISLYMPPTTYTSLYYMPPKTYICLYMPPKTYIYIYIICMGMCMPHHTVHKWDQSCLTSWWLWGKNMHATAFPHHTIALRKVGNDGSEALAHEI